jgi:hypothetical protein
MRFITKAIVCALFVIALGELCTGLCAGVDTRIPTEDGNGYTITTHYMKNGVECTEMDSYTINTDSARYMVDDSRFRDLHIKTMRDYANRLISNKSSIAAGEAILKDVENESHDMGCKFLSAGKELHLNSNNLYYDNHYNGTVQKFGFKNGTVIGTVSKDNENCVLAILRDARYVPGREYREKKVCNDSGIVVDVSNNPVDVYIDGTKVKVVQIAYAQNSRTLAVANVFPEYVDYVLLQFIETTTNDDVFLG